MSGIRISHNEEEHRYEARVDEDLVGFAEYRLEPGRVVFTHTQVDPAAEGRGVGSALVRAGLDDVAGRDLRVVPACPFVSAWIDRHGEYRFLVEPDER